ncbi:MAG: DNA topoisomerase 1 [Anaerolineae bacterium]|nr:DNA topoisomerase 1 [Anaerolineae bacterium]OQY79756.1 MAG: DNA topoisomerase I [Anaerolineae bacterium UTCFX5]
MEAYCFKCKTKRELQAPQAIFMDNGSPATTGTCPVCGGKLFRMGRTDAHEGLAEPSKRTAAKPKRAASKKPAAKRKTAKTASSREGSSKAAAPKASRKGTTATRKGAASTPKAKSKPASTRSKNTAAAVKTSGRRSGKLVIVESPAKAKSVGRYLGPGYVVKASKGHVRDLLSSRLSVDLNNDFEPTYRVPNDKRDTVAELKRAADSAAEIYLATDPDREGEAIAWHLINAANMDEERVRRVVFNEITESAVKDAFGHPRAVDMALVNAQQARRILDRIVGYQVSELLWEKVRGRLSAGRVQSIALRLVVDREREIEAFVSEEYWTIDAELRKQRPNGVKSERPFLARLIKINGEDPKLTSEAEVKPHVDVLKRSAYTVKEIVIGSMQRRPSAPFTTSTLQQEASRRLGFNARRTMSVAQQLYEGVDLGKTGVVGLITYMRTDSTTVSTQAQHEARTFISNRYGKEYMPARAPVYKTKAKGAQEAHEAVRPTSIVREPSALKGMLSSDQFKLYKLIWERFLASQMSPAVYDTLRVDITAGLTTADRPYLFRVNGRTMKFAGFMVVYQDTRDEDAAKDDDEGRVIPTMTVGEVLDLLRVAPEQHFTEPPPRYTEATLVKTLEEFGIGRPSTYAPIVGVIQDRNYVENHQKRLVPTEIGRVVNDLLVKYFPDFMDFQFTARMEGELDSVAEGSMEWVPVLHSFYDRFARQLQEARELAPRTQPVEKVGRICPTCNSGDLVIKHGRYGKFIGCSRYPDCKHTEPYLERTGVSCPQCGLEHGGELIQRKTKAGRTFYGCSRYPDCSYTAWRLPSRKGRHTEPEPAREIPHRKHKTAG